MSYNTGAIRELLKIVFDDQELIIFCYDHFRPVYDKFASEMSRLWKIQLLIDYCEKYDQFDELLIQLKDINPKQYAKFIPSTKGPTQTSKVGISTNKSQVEITLKGDLPNFTSELQFAAIGALAGVLNTPRDQISVLQIQAGGIILQLEMPTEAVNQLITLYEVNNPIMQDLGIQQVRIIDEQTFQTAAPISSSIHGKSQKAMTLNKEFGYLLDEGIHNVAKRQRKKISGILDDIGEKVNFSASMVDYWRRGNIPKPELIEELVRFCLKNGHLNYAWAQSLLTKAQYEDRKRLLKELFRSEDGGVIAGDENVPKPLPEFNSLVLKDLETPGGAVKLRDQFYIEREDDISFQEKVIKPGTTTTIYAPRQTGKTSLLVRGEHHAQQNGAKVVHLDMQSVNKDNLKEIDQFQHFLAKFISDELQLDWKGEIKKLWDSSELPPNQKLTNLLRRYILPKTDFPIVLAMDEVDRLLHTDFSEDFFGLIRSWHNSRPREEQWNKLSIVLIISTEPHLLIRDLSQSPFNVGLKIYLDDFNEEQVRDLNQRHSSPVTESDISQFMTLLNGQPYLCRMAFYTLATKKLTWSQLSNIATTDQGPFVEHLQHYHRLLLNEPDLRAALKEVIRRNRCVDEIALLRLKRAGLVKGESSACTCRCDLYRVYFNTKLK